MEKGQITFRYFQEYLKAKKQCHTDKPDEIYIKMVEEMGELARAIIRGSRHATSEEDLKGSVEEELFDIIYYTLMYANAIGVDLEHWITVKEALNNRRYPSGILFDPQGEQLLPDPNFSQNKKQEKS